jgi:NAD(P)-dependent dehydrogenase (short-subunit alcohol dehydrogenase family)
MKLKGKVALITGAGSGIGKAIALLFAREGADIAANGTNLERIKETASAARKLGRKAIAIRANVGDPGEVDRMVDTVVGKLGGIHILVNNAGVSTGGPTIDCSVEDWDRTVAVNFRGTFLCCQKAGRWMIGNGGGKIVNIASVAGIVGLPGSPAYGPSKAAIINITRVLAVEWAKHNVNVNALAPGYVVTPMMDIVLKRGVLTRNDMIRRTPLGRLAQPEDIAKAALFLASEDSSYVTGITLPVDGGYLAMGGPSV